MGQCPLPTQTRPEHAANLSSSQLVWIVKSLARPVLTSCDVWNRLAARLWSVCLAPLAPHANQLTSTVGWNICGLRAQCLSRMFATWAEGPVNRKQCRIEIVGLMGGPRCFFPAFVYRLRQWHSACHTSRFPGICGQKLSIRACAWSAQPCARGLQRLCQRGCGLLESVSCRCLCARLQTAQLATFISHTIFCRLPG